MYKEKEFYIICTYFSKSVSSIKFKNNEIIINADYDKKPIVLEDLDTANKLADFLNNVKNVLGLYFVKSLEKHINDLDTLNIDNMYYIFKEKPKMLNKMIKQRNKLVKLFSIDIDNKKHYIYCEDKSKLEKRRDKLIKLLNKKIEDYDYEKSRSSNQKSVS